MSGSIWSILGLEPTSDAKRIRRAYAAQLKVTNPEDDPKGFEQLRAAYEAALAGSAPAFHSQNGAAREQRREALAQPEGSGPPDYVERLQALDRLLSDGAASDESLDEAFRRLVAPDAISDLSSRVAVEEALAEMIARATPRSDRLIEPAILLFGWNDRTLSDREAGWKNAVLQRDTDLAFMAARSKANHPDYRALKALRAPMTGMDRLRGRLSPLLQARMRRLFSSLGPGLDRFEHDVNAKTVSWWLARLRPASLSAVGLWLIVVVPLLGVALYALGQSRLPSPTDLAVAWLTLLTIAVLAALFWLRAVMAVADYWRTAWAWRAPAWVAYGWAPLGLAILALSAVAPGGFAANVGILAAALFMLWWVAVTGEIDDRSPGMSKWLWAGMFELYLIIFWVWAAKDVSFNGAMPGGPSFVFLTCAAASLLGSASLLEWWHGRLSPGARRFYMLGLLVGGISALLLLFQAVRDPAYALPGITATALVIFAHRPLGRSLSGQLATTRHWLMWCGFLGIGLMSSRVGFYVVPLLGLLLVVGMVFAIVGGWRQERA